MNDIDMSQFVIPKSDQINADDLLGGPRTITVTRVNANEGNAEQPINVYFEGDGNKPFRPCKSMRRVMMAVWGVRTASYVGQSMTIYRDPKVKWGGMEVGGIRISHMTGLDAPKTIALAETRASRKPYTVQPLKVEEKADKAADGAKALIERINAGEVVADDPKVTQQREWLAKNRPDLAAQVDAALAAQEPAGGDDPFAEPADAATWQPFVARANARIEAATTAEALDEISEDIGAADHVPEDEIAKLDAAVSKKRRGLK